MDKPAFFNPDAITDSGFGIARHSCNPRGRVVRPPRDEILLLHYKHLGLDYLLARHAELDARRRSLDRERGYGYHYDPEVTMQRHTSYMQQAEELVPADWRDRRGMRRRLRSWRYWGRRRLGGLFQKLKVP